MATNYNPSIVTDGLRFCLDAANTKSYPCSGTTWTDISGKNHDGTLTNGPTFSSDNGGRGSGTIQRRIIYFRKGGRGGREGGCHDDINNNCIMKNILYCYIFIF